MVVKVGSGGLLVYSTRSQCGGRASESGEEWSDELRRSTGLVTLGDAVHGIYTVHRGRVVWTGRWAMLGLRRLALVKLDDAPEATRLTQAYRPWLIGHA